MKAFRCLLAVLLLLLGGGVAVFPAHSGEMVQNAVEATADEAQPDSCDRCDSSGMAMAAAACSAPGGCLLAVTVPGDIVAVANLFVSPCCSTKHMSGLQGSPEPFPPKSRRLV
jgi:hypothetical protein